MSQAQSRGCSRARFHADLAICAPLQLYVARVESQLDGSPGPNVRKVIDAQYDRVTAAIFDCLQQMAKMDGEGQGNEGKDQLNYHVILIGPSSHSLARALLRYMLLLGRKLTCVYVCVGAVAENMHHIIAVFTHKQRVPALSPFVAQARERYDQNLAAYIRLVLRRPLARPLVSARLYFLRVLLQPARKKTGLPL